MFLRLLTLVFSLFIFLGKVSAEDSKLLLSAEEKRWLQKNEENIVFGPDNFWPPLDFMGEDGEPAGMVADYVKIFEAKLGTTFKIKRFDTWAELLAAVRSSEVDFIGSVSNSEKYYKDLSFTEPYIELPLVVLVRNDYPKISSPARLNEMRLAVVGGYTSMDYIKEHFPGANYDIMDSDLTALLQTSFGHTDGTIVDLASASYLIDKYRIKNLTIGTELDYTWHISFATSKDNPILISILNKLMNSISKEKKKQLYDKWIHFGNNQESFFYRNSKSIIFSALIILFAIVAVIFYNRSLKSQIAMKTADLEKEVAQKNRVLTMAKESEENYRSLFDYGAISKWIYEVETLQILKVNQTAIQHYGYSEEEFLSMSILDLRPKEEVAALLDTNRETNKMDASHYLGKWKHLKKSGEIMHVEVYGYLITYKGRKCKSISCIDITQQLKDEQMLKDFADNLEKKVEIRTEELFAAHQQLQQQHREIQDSINYAKKIQYAIFPKIKEFKKVFSPSFIFFRPKNVVSGDFYWCYKVEGYRFAVIGDCTGHGVPGALLTMVGNQLLKQTIDLKKILQPKEMLSEMNSEMNRMIGYHFTGAQDGMDMAICRVDDENKELVYAGARISLFLGKSAKLLELRANKKSIGGEEEDAVFEEHVINYEEGDTIYLATDGFFDQFGGERDKKITKRRFKELITSVREKPIRVQCSKVVSFFKKWKGQQEQTDDVLMVGIKL